MNEPRNPGAPPREAAAFRLALRILHAVMRNDWPSRLARLAGADRRVVLERHEVVASQPLGDAHELRVGFAADFHAGPSTPDTLFDVALDALAREKPDVLLYGGDYATFDAAYLDRIVPRLAAVPAPSGRFAVFGNHDHRVGAAVVRAALESAGVVVLDNRAVRLASPFANTFVCGLDDHTRGRPDGPAAVDGASGARIVLMHQPSGLLDLGDGRFDVAVCGHVHGGQLALPGGRPIVVPHGALSRVMHAGRFDLGDGRVVLVSRGVGNSLVPFRWNAPADVLLVTLRGAPPGP